ncbi:uncharacterized protein METZ01_LOCUS253210, partial [marine metagenome]
VGQRPFLDQLWIQVGTAMPVEVVWKLGWKTINEEVTATIVRVAIITQCVAHLTSLRPLWFKGVLVP